MATIVVVQAKRNAAIPPIPPIAIPSMALSMPPREAAWGATPARPAAANAIRESPGRRFSRLRHFLRTEGVNALLLSMAKDLEAGSLRPVGRRRPCAPPRRRWRNLPPASLAVVLVVAAPPDARLVAPLRGAVEPLVHAPEAIQPARVRRVGVVDDAVLERERAHTRLLAHVRGRVG